MPRKSRKIRMLEDADDGTSAGRPTKRAKLTKDEAVWMAIDSSELGKEECQHNGKKVNRLLRAIPKEMKKGAKVVKTVASARKAKQSEKGRGVLAALLDAPLDILYEVALHFSPADLLSISRVSRQLRNFFLSKRNSQIWIKSFTSTDLPPCPQDLNEPQYASLVYDSDCIACGALHIRSLYCFLRLRLCKECYNLNVMQSDILAEKFCALGLYSISSEELRVVLKDVQISTPSFRGKHFYKPRVYYGPDFFDAFRDCLLAYRTKSEEDYKVFVDERLKWKKDVAEHAGLLQIWVDERTDERTAELEDICENHANSVMSRLRDLGYIDEDWTHEVYQDRWKDSDEWTKLAYQKRQLTDRTWKTLLPKLEEFLARRRQKIRYTKRREEFKETYLAYYLNLPLAFGEIDFLPSMEKMLGNKYIENFVFYDGSARPITEALWSAFLPTVQRVCHEFKFETLHAHERAVISRRLCDDKVLGGLGDLQHLLLASSFFFADTYFYNEIYFFNTLHSVGIHPPRPDHLVTRERPKEIWDRTFLNHNVVDVAIPDALLNELGLPLTTTMMAMQSMGARFLCARCDESFHKVLDWPGLVLHYIHQTETVRRKPRRNEPEYEYVEDHALDGGNLVQILNELEIASALEKQSLTDNLPKIFRCKICSHLRALRYFGDKMTEPQIQAHIRIKHNKEPHPEDRDVSIFN